MASASPSSYIEALRPYIRNWELSTTVKVEMLNRANDEFAAAAPWRWLCAPESAIAMDGSQEYDWTPSSGHVEIPLIYMETEGAFKILVPVGMTPTTAETKGLPSLFTITGSPGAYKIKLFPRPPAALDGNILPIMKKAHTRVTTGNWTDSDIFEWPDSYSHVFSAFLLDKLYQFHHGSSMSGITLDEGGGSRMTNSFARAQYLARQIMPAASMFYPENGGQ